MINGYKEEDVFICESCGISGWAEIYDGLICTECGGKLLYTGADDDEWMYRFYDEYNRNPKDGFELFEFVSKQCKNSVNYDEYLNIKATEEMLAYAEEISREYHSKPRCSKCGSTNIGKTKRGFSTGRAVAAGMLTGFLDVAAVAGAVGSNKMVNCCNECGHKWK